MAKPSPELLAVLARQEVSPLKRADIRRLDETIKRGMKNHPREIARRRQAALEREDRAARINNHRRLRRLEQRYEDGTLDDRAKD